MSPRVRATNFSSSVLSWKSQVTSWATVKMWTVRPVFWITMEDRRTSALARKQSCFEPAFLGQLLFLSLGQTPTESLQEEESVWAPGFRGQRSILREAGGASMAEGMW